METKIPFYNIVNMLLTGFIFIGCCIIIYFNILSDLLVWDFLDEINSVSETIITISMLAVIYEIGYIINRLGSVIIEPILKCTKAIPFDNDYKKFNDRKKDFPILSILSREYAVSRTSLTLFLFTTILGFTHKQIQLAFIFFVLSFIFLLSCRKHASKIVEILK